MDVFFPVRFLYVNIGFIYVLYQIVSVKLCEFSERICRSCWNDGSMKKKKRSFFFLLCYLYIIIKYEFDSSHVF